MFTGIIKVTTKPIKMSKQDSSLAITFSNPRGWKLKKGESINIDGICSTVSEVKGGRFSVFYMDETLRKTALSGLLGSHIFNLEPSLRASDLLGGHLLTGHIDTPGTVEDIQKEGKSSVLNISIPRKYLKYLIYKGSVAINGVSLTVVSVGKSSFSASLIPYTISHTNLGDLKTGDKVNIEVDLIAKYLEKLHGA